MVARKPGHQGEHGISVKPLRREGRMPPLNLYARVRFLLMHIAHETAGAARTRPSLRPLAFLGEVICKPRTKACRENAEACLIVIASAAKQSSATRKTGLLRRKCSSQ